MITTHVFDASNVEVVDPLLASSYEVEYTSGYPGGFLSAKFKIPVVPGKLPIFGCGQTLRVYDTLDLVWEGRVTNLTPGADSYQVSALGFWGDIFGARNVHKAWSDDRLDASVWIDSPTPYNTLDISYRKKMSIDRNNRLRFQPNSEQFNYYEYHCLHYKVPAGQTIKRIKGNYSLGLQYRFCPRKIYHWDGASYINKNNCKDGNAGTADAITISAVQYLYVAFTELRPLMTGVRFELSGYNTNASVLSAEYYNGAWTALTITDGTAVGGVTMAQAGDVTFANPTDWKQTGVGAPITAYWVRFQVSANMTAVTFVDIYWCENQLWRLAIYNTTSAARIFTNASAGSGTFDVTLAVPTTELLIQMQSTAQDEQTPGNNGTIFGEFTDLMVYTETGTITLDAIAVDVAAMMPELSTDTRLIQANTLALDPFYIDPPATALDTLLRAAAFGDSIVRTWALGIRDSDSAADRKPILFCEPYPVLTDREYEMAIRESGVAFEEDVIGVRNWIEVSYNGADGRTVYITPDEDASLKDDASIALYGRRQEPGCYRVNTANGTTALYIGQRYLAAKKDPQRVASGEIAVHRLRRKEGAWQTASRIQAGERIMFTDFYPDLSGSGMTQVITQARYSAADNICYISIGQPVTLDVVLTLLNEGRL